MSISSKLNSSHSAIIIKTDFSGKNCSTEKLISFFQFTQKEGDDDIGSNSISEIPNYSKFLLFV